MKVSSEDTLFMKPDPPQNRWLAVWHRLTTPSVEGLTAEVYYHTRLLLTLLVILIPANLIQLGLALRGHPYTFADTMYILIVLTALFVNLVVYRAGQRGHYHQAARGVIGLYLVLSAVIVVLNARADRPISLIYLFIPTVISSFFMSRRGVLVIGILCLAIMTGSYLIEPDDTIFRLMLVLAVIMFLLVVYEYYQLKIHHVERMRLAFSERHYRTLVETALEGIWVIDAEGRTTYVNQSMANMLGYMPDEMMGRRFSEFMPEALKAGGDAAFARRKQGEKTFNVDSQLKHRDGSDVWALVSAQPLYDEEGMFTGALAVVSNITLRKKAEDALRENEEHYRALVDVLAEGVVVLDDQGLIVSCNASGARILGAPVEQVIGLLLQDSGWQVIRKDGSHFPPEEFPGIVTLRTGEPQSMVTMGYYRPDLSLVWLSVNSRRLSDQSSGVVISFSDITEQIEMQERLRRRNEELVSVQAAAAAIATRLDPDAVLNMLVRRAVDLVKADGCVIYELQEGQVRAVAGHGPENWVADELRNPSTHPLTPLLDQLERPHQILAEQTTEHLDYVARYGIESMMLVPLHYQGSQLGSAVLIDQHGRREFKGWELSLTQMLMHHAAIAIHNARLFTQLRDSEERYRSLVELSEEAIVVGIHEQIAYANPAALRLFGAASLGEMKQHVPMDFVHPDDRPRVLGLSRKVYKEKERISLQEFKLLRLDGTFFHAETAAMLIYYEGDPAMLTVTRDITERKIAEQDRLDASIQKERMQLLETFISDTSHDLKTPLSVMKLKAYLLEKTTDPVKMRAHLDELVEQIDRLEKLIGSLHTMSRLDTAPNFVMAPLDINQVINRVYATMQGLASARQLTFSLDLAPTLPVRLADSEQLERALVNLVENAIQSTPQGVVTLRTFEQDGRIVCEVIDTGVGIPHDQREKIFERFYRLDRARSAHTGGTGLGLAIARRIIEEHGGQIEVESEVGKGSTFRVVL